MGKGRSFIKNVIYLILGCDRDMEVLIDKYFKQYCDLIYKKTGIYVKENKKETFKIKLNRSMRRMNMVSHEEFLKYLQGEESNKYFQEFINDITTNTTEFFREKEHFDFIEQNLSFILNHNSRISDTKEIRIWSAGCSTGQEAVSLAIWFKECLGSDINIKILATDIDTGVTSRAIRGIYSYSDCADIPKVLLNKYFEKVNNEFSVNEEIRSMINYRIFNLMQEHKFKRNFDIIFCRNVMIYFNNEIQEKLINKFYNHLVPGGLLFIGHSESLVNKAHNYKYVAPALYMK